LGIFQGGLSKKGSRMTKKKGMPLHKATKDRCALVELHATVGTPQAIIADILEIDPKTLRKHYRAQLDQATAKANAQIGGALYNKAKNGDTTAQIFWMKTRGRWRETNNLNLSNEDETMMPRVIKLIAKVPGKKND